MFLCTLVTLTKLSVGILTSSHRMNITPRIKREKKHQSLLFMVLETVNAVQCWIYESHHWIQMYSLE